MSLYVHSATPADGSVYRSPYLRNTNVMHLHIAI